MPVSPDYPESRIRDMLETAGSRILLQYGCGGIENTIRTELGCVDLAEYGPARDVICCELYCQSIVQ